MDNFLNRLAPRPSDYGGLPGKITRDDDAGNVYDETGRKIFNKFDQTEQPDSWLDTAISTATAPAKLATALVGSLNPYGQDGWQVPPIISEPAAAFARSGESTGFGDDGRFYLPNVQNPQVAQDTLTQLMTVYGGNALNPLAKIPAGSVGMFAGRRAKTADLNALAKAEKLAGQGASRDAIWNETGWFQGPDKQWRFEIDDSGAFMKGGDVSASASAGKWGPTLGNAMRHPELFAAYDDLGDIILRGQNGGGGSHTSGTLMDEVIGVDNSLRGKAKDSVALHEIQHAIQDRENFAIGGNPDFGRVRPEDKAARLDEIKNAARQVYEENRAKQASGVKTEDDLLLEELGLATPAVRPWEELTPREQLEWNDAGRFRVYNRLAGEVEARNVQKRMNMSADQRRASPPWTTQDIPDEDQIVRLLSDNRPSLMGSALASQADSLPMDQASRLQRAIDMGFDTENVYYHGTGRDFDAFDMKKANDKEGRKRGLGNGAGKVYLDPSPDTASNWAMEAPRRGLGNAPNVVPTYVRGELADESLWQNTFQRLSGGRPSYDSSLSMRERDALIARVDEELKQGGYAGIQTRYRSPDGSIAGIGQTAVFDPSNIRSVNAAFDPARAGENGLLLSDNKPSLLGSALASGQGEEDLLTLLGYR